MATATTQVTYDFSVTDANRAACSSQVQSLLAPYEESGVTAPHPTYNPEMSGTFPPPSGVYTATRSWTDATDAQTFVDAINSWLGANPTQYASNWTIQINP